MRIPFRLKTGLGLLLGLFALPVVAADNGCLTQGMLGDGGASQVVHYCAENRGMSAVRFRQGCQDLKDSQLQGLSPAEARKITFKSLSACPGNFKSTCDGAFGEKMSLRYMAGDTTLANGMARLTCEAGDGKWR